MIQDSVSLANEVITIFEIFQASKLNASARSSHKFTRASSVHLFARSTLPGALHNYFYLSQEVIPESMPREIPTYRGGKKV